MNRPAERVLSADEVQALLSAVDRGELPGHGGRGPGAGRRASPYDFRKPNRVSKDQVRMLQSIHDSFARLYSASLSSQLRGPVEVSLRGVEQVTFGEYLATLAPPACLVVFRIEPLKGGAAALEIDAGILFRFIDRLLGGSGLLPVRVRELTEVERVLAERLGQRAMHDLQEAWQHAGSLAFRVSQVETNPQFLQLTVPAEVVVVTSFDVTVGEESGRMTLVYPHLLLEPVMQRLGGHRHLSAPPRATAAEEDAALRAHLLRLRLSVRGVLAVSPVPVRRLIELQPGDVLVLDAPATAPARLELEGVPRFTGRPGTVNRRRALRVLTTIPKGEIIRDAGDQAGTARVHAP